MALLSKFRYCLLVFVMCVFLTLFVIKNFFRENYSLHYIPSMPSSKHLLVDGTSCKIPDLDPYDESIKHLLRKGRKLRCDTKPTLTYQIGNTIYVNNSVLSKKEFSKFAYCQDSSIVRISISDRHFKYLAGKRKFTKNFKLTSEFTRIRCYNTRKQIIYTNFYAINVNKPDAEHRYRKYFDKHVKQNSIKHSYNVILMAIDSVSRLNFIRHLKNTREFLLSDLGAIDMTGYNKVADNTFPNAVPFLSGKYISELPWDWVKNKHDPFDKYDFIFNNYASAGYRTMYNEDDPDLNTFTHLKEGFYKQPTDYYFRTLALAMENDSSIWWASHQCVHSRSGDDILLDYLYRFIKNKTVKHRPYFAFSFLNRITHNNLNKVALADDYHVRFLHKIRDEGLLNDTIMLYFSDHGTRVGSIRDTYIGKMAERLPAMFIYLPVNFRRNYPVLYNNVIKNSHRLTSPFDVYETLRDILYFNNSVGKPVKPGQRGISFFSEIPSNRSCRDADIMINWCACGSQEKVSVNDTKVLQMSEYIIKYINQLILNETSDCRHLYLHKIPNAYKLVPNIEMLKGSNFIKNVDNFHRQLLVSLYYLIIVVTEPGLGRFEATMKYEMKLNRFSVVDEIVRTNKYGKTSWCIQNSRLKNFCYCKSQQR